MPANLAAIPAKGLKLAFVTNNATRTVKQYLEMFRGFGAEVTAQSVFTSATVTAQVLSEKYPQGGNIFVVGETGLKEALKEKGFRLADHDCVAVVAALDRQVTYDKLTRATLLIRAGAAFYGTNPDKTLPSPLGEVPGAGSILAALEAASGVPPTIIGKPQPTLLLTALNALGLKPGEALMVGDRIETDLVAGQQAGCQTALVLSGVTSWETARQWRPAPDFIEADLAALLTKL